jgi:hypothetical protein
MSQKSFTTRKNRIDFDIDEEMFYLKPSIAAGHMLDASGIPDRFQAALADPGQSAGKQIMEDLSALFEEESFKRFEQRFWGEYGPIDPATFGEILEWIFGAAAGKETTQPQNS